MKFPTLLVSTLLGCVLSSGAGAAPKILLEPWMVVSENAQAALTYANAGTAAALVDEQALAGDPVAGAEGAPITHWFPGWDAGRFPASAVIDLRAEYDLSAIGLRDTNGAGDVVVSTGEPFAWTVLFADPMVGYGRWNNHAVQIRTRYLRVTLTTPGVQPEEIVVYGTLAPGQVPQPEPPAVPRPRLTMDQLIGTNAFIDDPLGVIEHAGNVREYHTWAWDEGNGAAYPGYPLNENAWSPSWSAGWDFDAFYRKLRLLGLEVSPVVWKTPAWLRGTGTEDEMKPIPLDVARAPIRDPLAPESYREHADHVFQYMARYGGSPVADSLLKLRANQTRGSGLGLLSYLENWNEQDKWWAGRESYFRPFEFAAMTSADWDGHEGLMGTGVGIRNADPNAHLVMGGVAVAELDYLRAVKLWFDFNRADFPLAAVNLHHYCNDGGGQGGDSTIGISPEADGLRVRFAAIADYRNRYLRDSELWVTEFGWDIDPRSVQRAPAIAGATAEEVQGRWIARAWLELAAAGVDRAHQYMMRDVMAPGTAGADVKFNTSGLVGPKGDWTPRHSWYYQATLRQRLRGLHYHDDLPLADPELRAYRFADAEGRVRAYAVWSGTANGRSVPAVSLPLPAGTTRATRVVLAKGELGGVLGELSVAGGQVTLPVDEKPTLVLLEGRNVHTRLRDRRLTLTAAQVTRESGSGDPAAWVDEQSLVGDPDMGAGGKPLKAWNPGSPAGNYPAMARLDLGLHRRVTKVYLHDFNSAGPFTVELGAPGAWRFLAEDSLTSYAAWRPHVVSEPTRHLRLTMGNYGANVAEVAVYARDYSGYGDWAERAYPGAEDFVAGAAAPAADPDGDGVGNLLEYSFGGDPRVGEAGLLPAVGFEAGRATLTYVRDLWLKDIAWQVEWSTDLVQWSTAEVVETVELATPDFERRRAEVPVAGRPRLFLRLRVSLSGAP